MELTQTVLDLDYAELLNWYNLNRGFEPIGDEVGKMLYFIELKPGIPMRPVYVSRVSPKWVNKNIF